MSRIQNESLNQAGSIAIISILLLTLAIIGCVAWIVASHSSSLTKIAKPTPPNGKQAQNGTGAPPPEKHNGQKISGGWHITTYYTAVEQYHSGAEEAVTGCAQRNCTNGSDMLGDFPADFVEKVKNEGTGRITTGPKAGKYLNWSYDTGYWLDTVATDSYGTALQPFRSAAADTTVLPPGASFRLIDCGADSGAIAREACDKLTSANWVITDQFTPGYGGAQHIDLYIGEEDRPNFETANTFYVDLAGVNLGVGSAK